MAKSILWTKNEPAPLSPVEAIRRCVMSFKKYFALKLHEPRVSTGNGRLIYFIIQLNIYISYLL